MYVIRNICKKRTTKKEKVHLWCEPSPCAQKYLQKTEKEKVHLWCEPSPGLVRPSVVFVARRHFDIVVELDYLRKCLIFKTVFELDNWKR